MLTRKALHPEHKLDINNNNLREYEPYVETDHGITIDIAWWMTLTEYTKQLIHRRLTKIGIPILFSNVSIPHADPDPQRTKYCMAVYTAYIEAFDFNVWADDVKADASCIKIPEYVKKQLAVCGSTGVKPNADIVNWVTEVYPQEVKQAYFARLSSTSGKNEKTPFPIENVQDLLRYLCQPNSILLKREYEVTDKDTYLILQPWKEIDKRYEFRAFFRNERVICASQQFCSYNFNYTQEELDTFQKALSEMTFPGIKYSEWVADVYWDGEQMCLIECNPYGAHCGAGSSLFNWHDDCDIFSGSLPGEFRYIHIVDI